MCCIHRRTRKGGEEKCLCCSYASIVEPGRERQMTKLWRKCKYGFFTLLILRGRLKCLSAGCEIRSVKFGVRNLQISRRRPDFT